MKPSKVGSRTVLVLKDSLTYQNCEELKPSLKECINQQRTELILDCKALSFLDSEALELLVRTHEELKDRGGILKLISLTGVCRDILIATRLTNTFHIYEDIHEAIRTGP
jgi:anti-sigma B factor antagonist